MIPGVFLGKRYKNNYFWPKEKKHFFLILRCLSLGCWHEKTFFLFFLFCKNTSKHQKSWKNHEKIMKKSWKNQKKIKKNTQNRFSSFRTLFDIISNHFDVVSVDLRRKNEIPLWNLTGNDPVRQCLLLVIRAKIHLKVAKIMKKHLKNMKNTFFLKILCG